MPKVDQRELHNNLAGKIVASIVKPVLQSGGDCKSVLILLESVVVGTVLAITRLGGDEIVLDVFLDGVKARLAKIRFEQHPPEGTS